MRTSEGGVNGEGAESQTLKFDCAASEGGGPRGRGRAALVPKSNKIIMYRRFKVNLSEMRREVTVLETPEQKGEEGEEDEEEKENDDYIFDHDEEKKKTRTMKKRKKKMMMTMMMTMRKRKRNMEEKEAEEEEEEEDTRR